MQGNESRTVIGLFQERNVSRFEAATNVSGEGKFCVTSAEKETEWHVTQKCEHTMSTTG